MLRFSFLISRSVWGMGFGMLHSGTMDLVYWVPVSLGLTCSSSGAEQCFAICQRVSRRRVSGHRIAKPPAAFYLPLKKKNPPSSPAPPCPTPPFLLPSPSLSLSLSATKKDMLTSGEEKKNNTCKTFPSLGEFTLKLGPDRVISKLALKSVSKM